MADQDVNAGIGQEAADSRSGEAAVQTEGDEGRETSVQAEEAESRETSVRAEEAAEQEAEPEKNKGKSVVSVFMDGAKEGFYIGVENILPAMVLGYVIIRFLEMTGLVEIIGKVFAPIMGIFGLPGEAAIVLMSAFFAKAAGAATAANLYAAGLINGTQATILIVPCMLMGTLVGHYARIVLVAGTNPKYRIHLLILPIFLSFVGMFVMKLILMLTGNM